MIDLSFVHLVVLLCLLYLDVPGRAGAKSRPVNHSDLTTCIMVHRRNETRETECCKMKTLAVQYDMVPIII